ncbi:MAG: hypothetical protein MUE82_12640 [Chloroflexi bacterium]|nr:hypothetical protein [Chloroflexota bacterium]
MTLTVREYVAHPNPLDPVAQPAAYAAALQAHADRIAEQFPALPVLTAFIMAQDAMSADRATDMVRAGVPFDDALPFVGSYARIGWMLDMVRIGKADRGHVLDLLPDYWPGADPDDTDPRFLVAWTEAWVRNGRRTITDRPGTALPAGRYLTIYRGQSGADGAGIAWSLSEAVAKRFARGASVRVPGGVPDPVVYTARVARRTVLAYLTGRGEDEVIVNPFALRAPARESVR